MESPLTPRKVCHQCENAAVTCYCARLSPFRSTPRFIILMHPHEARRKVVTGRMAHLSLSNSSLYKGIDFTNHEALNAVLADEKTRPLLLFPTPNAFDLSTASREEYAAFFPENKESVVIVLDGTWRTARTIYRMSPNLHGLPTVRFTPPAPSQFRIRKQPEPHCYATIEAIAEVIRLYSRQFASQPAGQETLLLPFAFMVDQQLEYRAANQTKRHE